MVLAERGEQLRFLSEVFEGARDGRGSAVVIDGSAATGKSALLHRFCEQVAEAGGLVLTAAGSVPGSRLPLEVMSQLFGTVVPGRDDPEELGKLLYESAVATMWSDEGNEAAQQVLAPVMHRLWSTLVSLSAERPVLVAVDDVHHADPPSLRFLHYFAHRLREARILLVMTELDRHGLSLPVLGPELHHLPHSHRLRVAPLTEEGVATVLARHGQGRRAAAHHALTGGNPLLLQALIADRPRQRQATPRPGIADRPRQRGETPHPGIADRPRQPEEAPHPGEEFARAVFACLRRGGEETMDIARGLAVLGPGRPELLAGLLATDPARVAPALRALTSAGLLADGDLRHPHLATTVLHALGQEQRARLHLRAARLLHDGGAGAGEIAAQLTAAGSAPLPWMPELLATAARDALADDRVDRAVAYLELAGRSAADRGERARYLLGLAGAEWRTDAAKALRHLPELAESVRNGDLSGLDRIRAAKLLLWYGRLDRPGELLEGLAAEDAEDLRQWLALALPRFAEPGQALAGDRDRTTLLPVRELEVEATHALAAVLTRGGDAEAVVQAERVLESVRLDDSTVEPIVSALLALVYADRTDRSARWCAVLSREAAARQAASWQALITAVEAEIALRRGVLPQAERLADAALALLRPHGWGVAVGLPLSTLLLATTVLGKHDAAALRLAQPVPEAMYGTRYGLHYLYARGRYFLATERYHAALADFTKCGSLMSAWRLDMPAFIPWRTGAAAAHLAMGRSDQARRLATEQLDRPGAGGPRTRGITLRVLAAASEQRRRPPLLKEAVEALKEGGDRLELAWALADLSSAQRALGQTGHARTTGRFASQVARTCQAFPPPATRGRPREVAPPPEDADGISALSDAERRVAALAARGETNHEIARSLFITVSTVEQHLTRVYRKLRISGRAELPTELAS
ncbi:AAA family ATPase [Nonomuraea longicatena]|uniref:LuxR family transcriptional regulator n=1 Tax=Nonomuraea longicatena TaxID=83682 RepID=A0ABN1NQ18_9ACTN